jgi:hypothetical protein
MAGVLGEVEKVAVNLQREIDQLHRTIAREVGEAGRDELNAEATRLWGSDRKFSGSERSAKAKRAADASYRIQGDSVVIYPTGDPWYITAYGRAKKPIKPRRRRGAASKSALRFPDGEVRLEVVGGVLPARPGIIDRSADEIADKSHLVTSKATDKAIDRAVGPRHVRVVL